MTALPNGDRAIVDIRKLEEYCLSPAHPRGRHKVRVFREVLGIDRSAALWLRNVLLDAARTVDAVELATDAYGIRWQVDAAVERHGKSNVIRTIWMVRSGEDVPRFVTCWVL